MVSSSCSTRLKMSTICASDYKFVNVTKGKTYKFVNVTKSKTWKTIDTLFTFIIGKCYLSTLTSS
jgi:hypothetical protein